MFRFSTKLNISDRRRTKMCPIKIFVVFISAVETCFPWKPSVLLISQDLEEIRLRNSTIIDRSRIDRPRLMNANFHSSCVPGVLTVLCTSRSTISISNMVEKDRASLSNVQLLRMWSLVDVCRHVFFFSSLNEKNS